MYPTEGSPYDAIRGLNMEFDFKEGSIIGQMGMGKFDICRDYKKARNPFYGTSCPSLSKVDTFIFRECKVILEGELYETGEKVVRVEEFKGERSAWHYLGRKRYAWLTLIVAKSWKGLRHLIDSD